MNIKLTLPIAFVIAATACTASVDAGRSSSSQLDQNGDNGTKDPPGDPGEDAGSACWWGVVESASTNVDGCEDDAALESAAQVACGDQGGELTAFTADEACGKGRSQAAKYECCPATPPPPCFSQTVGDAKQCRSDAELEKLAETTCADQKAKLAKFAPDEACPSVPPEGASYFATIACCY